MVKCNTLGMLDVAKINPVLTSQSAVTNYSFITVDGDLYLVANEVAGDSAYVDDYTIPAGDYLNGYLVEAWKGQELVIDGKHIDATYANLAVDNLLTAKADGTLEVAAQAPNSGVYFKITKVGATLTEAAVKVKVMVA